MPAFSLPYKLTIMKNCLLVTLLLFTGLLFAQDYGTVKGTILDKEVNNEPLMFASVMLKDTDMAVETNLHGNFEIEGIVPGLYTLIISYPGYEERRLPLEVTLDRVNFIQEGLGAKKISLAEVAGNEGKPVGKDDTSTADKSAIRR